MASLTLFYFLVAGNFAWLKHVLSPVPPKSAGLTRTGKSACPTRIPVVSKLTRYLLPLVDPAGFLMYISMAPPRI